MQTGKARPVTAFALTSNQSVICLPVFVQEDPHHRQSLRISFHLNNATSSASSTTSL
jgi:hypothetical protein